MKLTELDTPSLLIDRDKLIRNIARAKASDLPARSSVCIGVRI